MITTCTKPEAATRQLNVSINLLFANYDPLAVRTLAGAAHGIFSDLVDLNLSGSSWRAKDIKTAIEVYGLSSKDAHDVFHRTQNYLKHADRDPTARLDLDEEENDYVIFNATLECATLGYKLSLEMQAFQVWFLASYPEKIGNESELVLKSKSVFPNLTEISREESLALGAEFLEVIKTNYAAK